MKKKIILLVILLCIAILSTITYKKINANKQTDTLLHTSLELPDNFQLRTLDNQPKILKDLSSPNQPTLLVVWASWCASCASEMPALHALKKKGWRIIGLDFVDSVKNANVFLKKYGDPFLWSVQDPSGILGVSFGVTGTPEALVLDKNGTVQQRIIGAIHDLKIEKI